MIDAPKRRSVPKGDRCGVFLLLLLPLVGCEATQRPQQERERTLVIGVPEGSQENSDIGVGQLADLITTETLTQVGVDGRALPRLAQSWSWEREDRRLRLRLRNDVRLHDGRPFDSQLAAEALAIAMSRPRNRAGYPALRDVTAAIPDGPSDLLLELSNASAWLPEDLAVLINVPAGPYRPLKRSQAGIELERFDSFYLGTPIVTRVLLRPFDTLRIGWASLLRGDLDFVYDVPADAVEFVRSDDIRVLPVKRWYQFAIAFNSRKGPLQSPHVRRALNMAVDRNVLVRDVLHGAASPSFGPLWPNYWAAESSSAALTFDRGAASSLLDATGFPLRRSEGESPASRFSITCLIPENFSVLERIALHVQKDLFNIGVDLRFKLVPVDQIGPLLDSGEFEAVMLDMISGPTPARAYIFWASAERFRGTYNIFGYENPESERLFEILRRTRNEAAVRSATRRLQRVLLEDPPALFLAWNERREAIRQEFVVPDERVDPVFTLWRWKRRTDTLAASAP